MAVLPIIPPRLVGAPGLDSPVPRVYSLAPGAVFREGDFGIITATGTVTGAQPAPTGSLATSVGPTFSGVASFSSTATLTSGPVTLIGVTTSGAPAQSYYVILTYTAAGTESAIGAEFVVSCAAGYTFSINVASAGAPTGSTNFAAYISTYQGGELLQQASRTTTALGAAYPVTSPLSPNVGVARALTNSVGTASTPITGIALADSQALWATGVGGSFTAGNIANLLGAWMPAPTLGPIDPSQAIFVSVANGQPIEICLLQPWNNSLIGSGCGLNLTSAGYFVADTAQSNKIFTIVAKEFGSPADVGGVGDTYSRVQVIANSTGFFI